MTKEETQRYTQGRAGEQHTGEIYTVKRKEPKTQSPQEVNGEMNLHFITGCEKPTETKNTRIKIETTDVTITEKYLDIQNPNTEKYQTKSALVWTGARHCVM